MKLFALLLVSAFALTAQASDCDRVSRLAVTCYELGHLAGSYDETGEGCGVSGDSLWTVAPSTNPTLSVRTVEFRKDGYMGGRSRESRCEAGFRNAAGELCFLQLHASIGSEDADLSVESFTCR